MPDDLSQQSAAARFKLPRTLTNTGKGVYLLPNLLTTGTLFCGFYAILSALQGESASAAISIFAAMIFDGLDGRVARLTNTQSQFGVQYDSLSDMVAFGVAPAIVAHVWILDSLGNVGMAAAFIYTSCAALRLARFNVSASEEPSRFFYGLASPAAAAVVASVLWVGTSLDKSQGFALVVALLTAGSGVLMASNLCYPSFKQISFTKPVPFVVVLGLVIAAAVVVSAPEYLLLLCSLLYSLFAPMRWLWKRVRPT